MNPLKFHIGIQEIATYIPQTCIDNLEQGKRFDVEESFILEKIGCRSLPRLSEGESVTSACASAYQRLLQKLPVDSQEIECIVVCTQTPDRGGIPHTSALVQAAIGASENCACFDIGLGCSGYVYSLQVVASFMQMHGMKKGLLFTCDPYSRILDADDKNTSLLFGDAATVTLLSDAPRFTSEFVRFSTRGSAADALTKQDGLMHMNGRAVFNFALTDVVKQVSEVIETSSVAKESIDLFLLHQGSRFMIENVIKKIGGIQDRSPVSLGETGNTVSSSLPILLEKVMGDSSINRLLMSGFGVGLSWATAIYSRNEESAA